MDGEKPADVFFAHPTTQIGFFHSNIPIPTGKTVCTGPGAGDPDLMLNQASAFTSECNLYAPKYREASFFVILAIKPSTNQKKLAHKAKKLRIAYQDLKSAFTHFLDTRPDKTKPFILAGHSQGAVLLTRVLAECVEGTKHEEQFVAAYLCGGYLPAEYFEGKTARFTSLHPCTGPEDTKCIISWDTRAIEEWKPENIHQGPLALYPRLMHWATFDEGDPMPSETDDVANSRIQINPQTWDKNVGGKHLGVTTHRFPKQQEKGSDPTECNLPPADYNSVVKVDDKAVYVQDPTSTWIKGCNFGMGNMHGVDIQFWYYNIRENVGVRLKAHRSPLTRSLSRSLSRVLSN